MCALSAILAGTLRTVASFIPETTPSVYVVYFAIDLLLLLGSVGLYQSFAIAGKVLGLLGVGLMVFALLVLIARDLGVLTPGAYAVGAGLFSLGLDVFSVHMLRNVKVHSWIPVCWIASTIIGAIGFLVPGMLLLFAVSGLLFGIAFAAAGVAMWV